MSKLAEMLDPLSPLTTLLTKEKEDGFDSSSFSQSHATAQLKIQGDSSVPAQSAFY